MKYYFCIENQKVYSEQKLYDDFLQFQKENPEEYNYSFDEYIVNCKTENNGSLMTLDEKLEESYNDLHHELKQDLKDYDLIDSILLDMHNYIKFLNDEE